MEDYDPYDRPAPDSPDRCQAVTGKGQCQLRAVPGGKYCVAHGGASILKGQERAATRTYRVAQWRTRMSEFSDDPKVKGLREEIGILRLLLETQLNQCRDATDLMLNSQGISALVEKVEKVVVSCHKLETNLGQTMDKQALIAYAQRVISIIADCLSVLSEEQASSIGNTIANRMLEAISDDA